MFLNKPDLREILETEIVLPLKDAILMSVAITLIVLVSAQAQFTKFALVHH